MPTTSFGSPVSSVGYVSSSHSLYSDGVPLPQGRQMANGERHVIIDGVSAYVQGLGASRSIRIGIGSAVTGAFTVSGFSYNGSNRPASTSMRDTNNWVVNGGTARLLVIPASGTPSLATARGSGGTTVSGYNGASYAGRIPGSFHYVQAPTAPRNVQASPSSTAPEQNVITWEQPSDGGESAVTSYVIFRNGVKIGTVGRPDRTFTDTSASLTTGTSYSYQVAATNAVTDARNTTSVLSSTAIVTATGGQPTAPTLSAATNWSAAGTVSLTWTYGTVTGGGTQYANIYRNGVRIASGISGTSYTDKVAYRDGGYSYTASASTSWGLANGLEGARSLAASATPSTVTSAPRNLTAVQHATLAGRIVLTWDRPVTDLGITSYRVMVGSAASTVAASGADDTYTATVTPGLPYAFKVAGINPLGVGMYSSTVTAQADGDPDKPTSVEATADGYGALEISWVPPSGTLTGYTLYDYPSHQILAYPAAGTSTYLLQGMAPGIQRRVYLRARTQYTDESGSQGGPISNVATGTTGTIETQTPLQAYSGVANEASPTFNGTKVITATTATTFSFANASSYTSPGTVASFVVTNTTNQALSGQKTITGVGVPGSSTTFSFAQTAPNVPPNTTSGGSTVNDTNQTMSGTYTVTGANPGDATFTYAKVMADVNTRDATGIATNRSNQYFNVTGASIIATTDRSISYARNLADIAPAAGGGTITNVTIRDHVNGTFTIDEPRRHDTIEYTNLAAPDMTLANRGISNASFEDWGTSTTTPTGWAGSSTYTSREMMTVRRGDSAFRLSAPASTIVVNPSTSTAVSYTEHGNQRMFMYEIDVYLASGSASGLVISLTWTGNVTKHIALGDHIEKRGTWYRIRGFFDRGATAGTVTGYVLRASLNAYTTVGPAAGGDVIIDYFNVRRASANEEAAAIDGAIPAAEAHEIDVYDDHDPTGDESGVRVADSKGSIEVVYRPGWSA